MMLQMLNTEATNSGVLSGGVAISAHKQENSGLVFSSHNKQPPSEIKKTALRDVQNQASGLAQNHRENSTFLASGANTDAVRVCGNKRLTPERPSSSAFYPTLTNSCANEHIMNARRRFELELGRGRVQSNTTKVTGSPQSGPVHQLQQETPQRQTHLRTSNNYPVPRVSQNNMPPLTSSFGGSSAPNFLGKYATRMQPTQSDSLRVTLECPSSVDYKGTRDQQTMERYIHLQNFLKECDESNCQDYIHVLRHLSPAELSRHAFELEARAIQLAMEEGKEMHRMKALNILGKSTVTGGSPQATSTLTSNTLQNSRLHPRN